MMEDTVVEKRQVFCVGERDGIILIFFFKKNLWYMADLWMQTKMMVVYSISLS